MAVERRTPTAAAGSWKRRLLAPLAFALAGAIVILAVAAESGSAIDVVGAVDQWLFSSGLGIEQVSLEGHRFTPDADIFDALDLPKAGSMVRFNGGEAAARILKLPWVQRVQIKPLVPNGLHVVVTERTPFAVWEPAPSDAPDHRRLVVDASGHVLAGVGADAFNSLPRIRGAAAPATAADLHATLSLFPAIAGRLIEAERIGERRWVLRLTPGIRIHLPAREEAAALQKLAALHGRHGLLDKDVVDIDLRDPSLTVRLRSPMLAKAPRAAASGPDLPEGRP